MIKKRYIQSGLTLVELMISMVLGLIVVGMLGTAVQSQFRTASMSQALSSIQAKGRFAMDELASAVQSSGYIGCASTTNAIPAMPYTLSGGAMPRPSFAPLQTFVVNDGAWSPNDPEGYSSYSVPTSGAGTPIPTTHAILIEGGISEGVPLASSTLGPQSIYTVRKAYGFETHATALLSDCSKAEVLFIESATGDGLGGMQIDAMAALTGHYEVNDQYPESTRLIPYRRALYYIGDSGRVTPSGQRIRSLFEHLYPFGDSAPEEIVEGVEALVITHRQMQADGTVREYLAGDPAINEQRNTSIRLSLMVTAPVRYELDTSNQEYVMAGLTVGVGNTAAVTREDDNRIRRVFEQTINVRNASRELR